ERPCLSRSRMENNRVAQPPSAVLNVNSDVARREKEGKCALSLHAQEWHVKRSAFRFLSNSSAPVSGVEEGGPGVSAPDPRPCIRKEPPHPAGYTLGREVVGTCYDHYREERGRVHVKCTTHEGL